MIILQTLNTTASIPADTVVVLSKILQGKVTVGQHTSKKQKTINKTYLRYYKQMDQSTEQISSRQAKIDM